MAENLSVRETRQRVREILGKTLKWQLIPIRLDLETFEALKRISPGGDMKKLIEETIRRLLYKLDRKIFVSFAPRTFWYAWLSKDS